MLDSDATTRLEAELAQLGLTHAVDSVVNTARIGVARPDPRVYQIAAQRAGVPASRCLYHRRHPHERHRGDRSRHDRSALPTDPTAA
ncbi:hypothetical protein ACGFYP_02735 [Streptomyces sp. NPDC048370]|uniref:hypothetical protein n=1 Tax=Streptomyces sp. NPDC048370 TaxID=3365540 RepID=UPI003711D7E4